MFSDNYIDEKKQKMYKEGIELKENGHKIVGVFCTFTPKELIAAAGAVPVGLCAGSQKTVIEAEKHLPKNLCPLIKSSYGFALTDTCPYFANADFIIADATCDGKKKMFELLNKIKPLYMLKLPQTSETKESIEYWLSEINRMKEILERETGNTITDEALTEQIKLYNRYNRTLKKVYELNTAEVPLVYGSEIDAVILKTFQCNLENRIEELEEAINTALAREKNSKFIDEMKNKKRILVTGCPTANPKIINIIEESGAVVVGLENCGGLKTLEVETDETIEPMRALAERSLKISCPCLTPNDRRFKLIENLIDKYNADGVVELTWQACHTYNVEAFSVKEFVRKECNKPYIQIETDYTENDNEQIKTRIQAFLEMII